MADDGMLVNFTIGDGIIKPEPKFKGGTWRDRLSAKKIAQHRSRSAGNNNDNSQKKQPQNPNKVELPSSRPAKRQKTEGDFKPSTTTTTTDTTAPSSASRGSNAPKLANRTLTNRGRSSPPSSPPIRPRRPPPSSPLQRRTMRPRSPLSRPMRRCSTGSTTSPTWGCRRRWRRTCSPR